jgi:CheY-like chemotaxis protein
VESVEGVGSTFWFELAVAATPQMVVPLERPVPQNNGPAQGLRPWNVLYVEDNPANMKLVEQLISRHPNLRLSGATTGRQGVTLARLTLPDVILMDINLPDINGIEALHILRQDPLTRAIPIIAVSANAMPHDIERGMQAGFYRYLTKPIKVQEFMDTLNSAFELLPQSRAGLDPALLRDWDPQLLANLKDASLAADLDSILALLDDATTPQGPAAEELRALARAYAYQRLVTLVTPVAVPA